MINADIIEKLKAHATRNYESHGWDIMIETMDDDEIEEALLLSDSFKKDPSVSSAISAMQEWLLPLLERREDIQATAW